MKLSKIIVTGPECSGKSTLAEALVAKLDAKLVPEISRSILLLAGNNYSFHDLKDLAQHQFYLEQAVEFIDDRMMICDTSALVYKIWLFHRFGISVPFVEKYFAESNAFFVLCQPLAQWQEDSLRVNQYDRDELFDLYKESLDACHAPYLILPDLPVEERVAMFISHWAMLDS